MRHTALFLLALPSLHCLAQDAKSISNYVVDITAGSVSAGSLAGVNKTAITEIQTSQDLVVAIQPLTSSSSTSKDGFGIAITPFRTTIVPMNREFYLRNLVTRALGSTTLSYAENVAAIGATKYRKNAWSIDVSAFFNKEADPVYVGQFAADTVCNAKTIQLAQIAGRRQEEIDDLQKEVKRLGEMIDPSDPRETEQRRVDLNKANDALIAAQAAQKKASDDTVSYLSKCIDTEINAVPWNAARWQLSVGSAWGKPEDGPGIRRKAGDYATLNALIPFGYSGAVYVSLRRTRHELDFKTFTSVTASEKNASLAAVRYTYGSHNDNGNLKALAEISNAKANTQTSSNSVFKYAVGVDMRLTKGVWLEFRVGRARTWDDSSLETTGLLNLNIGAGSLSSLLSSKK